jgi:glycerate dehydrogenase
MRSVFLDYATVSFHGDLDPSALRRAMPGLELRDNTPQAAVPEAIAGATVVALNKLRITRETIAASPGLRLIVLAATGTNNVDLEAAREHGIGVCNLRDYCTASVVQHVLGTLLLLTQRLREYDALVRAGAWSRGDQFCLLDFPIRELAGRKLGIVGHGALGRGVARAASLALGMEVWIANRPGGEPHAGRHMLDALLPQVDVLSLHCPLNPQTQGLIGARELARMKPDALLINTARGALVDSQALADALRAPWMAIPCWPWTSPTSSSRRTSPGLRARRASAAWTRWQRTSRIFCGAAIAAASSEGRPVRSLPSCARAPGRPSG